MFASKDVFLKSSGTYTIGRSARFRSSASAYLSKTYGTAGNTTTFTYSVWAKRGSLSSTQYLFWGGNNCNFGFGLVGTDDLSGNLRGTGGTNYFFNTSAVFRDPSAWYHIVLAVDTTQATDTNRLKLYVNGVQQTLSATYPAQNTTELSTAQRNIGAESGRYYFDGCLTEINFIDGQALTPSSFGVFGSNGVWQPAKYTGTYGTNGFYLNFSSYGTAAALGTDFSGNSNTWTVNNLSVTAGATYDAMQDTPTLTSTTAANYAVINPLTLYGNSNTTLSNGNLNLALGVGGQWRSFAGSTIVMSPGTKWYFEGKITNSPAGNDCEIGIAISTAVIPTGSYNAGANTSVWYYEGSAIKNNGSGTSYGATYGAGDVIGVALDMTNGQLTFYKNGASQGLAFTVSTSQSYVLFLGGASTVPSWALNFGQQPWAYAPPTGFVGTNTYNLSTPTIPNGATQMAATLYTGNSTSLAVANTVNGTNFQPDFVWIKNRSGAISHSLYDSVRGAGLRLSSNETTAQLNYTAQMTGFNSNGFSVATTNNEVDESGTSYVAWQWKANGGTGVSNTNGSITSTVSANTTAGFSIVTYTGTGIAATIGHGLGVAPSIVIVKPRSATGDWIVYTNTTGAGNYLLLDTTAASTASTTKWNNTAPTSSVFSVGIDTTTNTITTTYVAYCFAAVAGYSAFGSYTGNGSTDGPFVFLGFRPRFFLAKVASGTTGGWHLIDTSRSPYNEVGVALFPNLNNAEASDFASDILSNGLKMRNTQAELNGNGNTYIYMAFAENPFKYSLAR